jgi:ethanolamine ammonia-lyase large subunit
MPVVPMEDRSLQKVHDIDLTKNEIYDASLEWMAQTLSGPREVIELKDKDNGKIIGKGITSFRGKIGIGSTNVLCRFTLIVEAKDNKYRTTYNNFVGLWGESYNRPEPVDKKEYIDSVKAKLALLDEDLYNYLKKSKSNANW